jgi:hypothetical protein
MAGAADWNLKRRCGPGGGGRLRIRGALEYCPAMLLRARPARIRRRPVRIPLVTVLLALVLLPGLSGCGSSAAHASHPAGSSPAGHPRTVSTRSATATRTATRSTHTATTGAGKPGTGTSGGHTTASGGTTTAVAAAARRAHRLPRVLARIAHIGRLPQTSALPSADTPVFHAEMRALWAAVRSDRPALGLPAFFPLAAYLQIKAIYDARADWQTRLFGDFALDVRAAHALLGSDPASARLLDVSVPSTYAHWIPPGVCDNTSGYYEMPNARVVFRAGGTVRSFGIASMISWRGLWFVVHLGAVLRSASVGVVDSPSIGAGISAPSGTC